MKYRPKQLCVYIYQVLIGHSATISCYPQSRWILIKSTDNKVKLVNRNVTIELSKDDFEKNWKAVEE